MITSQVLNYMCERFPSFGFINFVYSADMSDPFNVRYCISNKNTGLYVYFDSLEYDKIYSIYPLTANLICLCFKDKISKKKINRQQYLFCGSKI
jgi:hypothetical protein